MDIQLLLCLVGLSFVSFVAGYFVGKPKSDFGDEISYVDDDATLPREAYYNGRLSGERIDVICICPFRHNGVDFVLCALKGNNMLPPFSMRKDKLIFPSEEK